MSPGLSPPQMPGLNGHPPRLFLLCPIVPFALTPSPSLRGVGTLRRGHDPMLHSVVSKALANHPENYVTCYGETNYRIICG